MRNRLLFDNLTYYLKIKINFVTAFFYQLHTTEVNDGYEWGRLNLQSVTAESSLQEFLSTAELAHREFTAEKLNLRYVKSVPMEVAVATSQPNFDEPLTVPRRYAY